MNAVIFPGQGAQYVGMGKSLYAAFSEAKDVFDRIDSVAGFAVSEKCFTGTPEELKDTALQQLAILATSLAAYEVFKEKSIPIAYYAGLSLGEYSCLYPAGVLSLEDVVRLVKERAFSMQEAAKKHPSTMLAVIGLPRGALKELEKGEFYIANINAPVQIAVSVSKEKAAAVAQRLTGEGARVVPLEVSGGFHSPFMDSARERLKAVMESLQFHDANTPIVSNVTAAAHIKAGEIKENLVQQLNHPVLWKQCVDCLCSNNISVFFEIGPSRILKGLMRKINSSLKVTNIEKREDLDSLS